MDFTAMIRMAEDELKKEEEKLEEQTRYAEELSAKFSEANGLVRITTAKVKSFRKIVDELKKLQEESVGIVIKKSVTKISELVEDRDYNLLMSYLDKAYDKVVLDGIAVESAINTRTGRSVSIRNMIVSRAEHALTRYCPLNTPYTEFLANLDESTIDKFRDVGKKTAAVIRVAKEYAKKDKEV